MSLINDALRRASQAHRGGKQEQDVPPMRYAPPAQARRGLPRPLLIVLPVLLLAAAIVAWRMAGRDDAPPDAVAQLEPAAPANPRTTRSAEPADVPAASGSPSATAPVAPIQEPAPVSTPEIETMPAVVASESPATSGLEEPAVISMDDFPELRLQGVFYHPVAGSVIIDGRTLSVGETIREVRVAKIEPGSVTLEWRGLTRVLRLGGRAP